MNTLRQITEIVISAERPAIVKTSVGFVGTWISAHEIQIYVGVATLIFIVMQIIVITPKVKATLRQMAVERERKRQLDSMYFSDIKFDSGDGKRKVTFFSRIRKLFTRKER